MSGSPPNFIVECSRRRVPRGMGVPIVGMSEREPKPHVIDPDCPLCAMMEDGMFGVGFSGLDGHHLDLDGELAFLLTEIVSVLQSLHAPRTEIRELNALFTDFRTCRAAELADSGRRLGDQLDSLTERYPDLISRVADFRSRIDERVRSPVSDRPVTDDGLDLPL